ncbi:MAG TPA: hypothetical protein VG797_03355 [Phycisphaerales bacterium]|nr:hypothetical protein [Phycisphaerales bacterium]
MGGTKRFGKVVGLFVVGAAAVLLTGMSALGASRAIVVTGWDSKQANRDAMTKEADLAESIYREKGYSVTRVDHVSKDALLALFCLPDATMFFYAGHGVVANDHGDGLAMLDLIPNSGPEGQLGFQEVIDRVPPNCRNKFRQLVLNACAQRQVGWVAAFPMATVWGWDVPIPSATCYNDLKANGSDRTAAKGTRGAEEGVGPGLAPPHVVDPRIVSAIPVGFDFSTRTFRAEGWWDYGDMPWKMPAALATDVGHRTFNVYTGNSPEEMSLLKSIEVDGGEVIGESIIAHESPDFEVLMTAYAFEAATADIESLPGLFVAGDASISGNTTGVPDATLFMGVAAVTFGKGAELPPVCEGDANHSGAVTLGDIAAVLSMWGVMGVPGQLGDLDGNGVRGLGDIARVIGHWGEVCE